MRGAECIQSPGLRALADRLQENFQGELADLVVDPMLIQGAELGIQVNPRLRAAGAPFATLLLLTRDDDIGGFSYQVANSQHLLHKLNGAGQAEVEVLIAHLREVVRLRANQPPVHQEGTVLVDTPSYTYTNPDPKLQALFDKSKSFIQGRGLTVRMDGGSNDLDFYDEGNRNAHLHLHELGDGTYEVSVSSVIAKKSDPAADGKKILEAVQSVLDHFD